MQQDATAVSIYAAVTTVKVFETEATAAAAAVAHTGVLYVYIMHAIRAGASFCRLVL